MRREQRTLHALSRLTFGPRPGESAEVDRIGLKRWFEAQLHPETIDDSALDARLSAFPAMALPQPELMQRYPGPQRLKTMAERNDPLPSDPVEHAIYADGIAFYKQAEARKAAAEVFPADAPLAPTHKAGTAVDTRLAGPPSQAGARRPGRVDLLPADSAYTMPVGKKSAASAAAPTMPPSPNVASIPSAASNLSPVSTPPAVSIPPSPAPLPALDQGEMAFNTAARGKPKHDEAAFPEAATSAILALPPDDRVRRVLALEPTRLVDFRRSLSQPELASLARDLTPRQKEIFAALGGSERMIGAELLESRLERDVYSRREVEAVMTDFWLNHFNVYLRKNQNEPYLLPAYERETIRPHALGRFEDLLVATARSPAMLMYLDNWESVGPDSQAAQRGARNAARAALSQAQKSQAQKSQAQSSQIRKSQPTDPLAPKAKGKPSAADRGLNENYARELMELHTLGVSCEVSRDHTARQLRPACGKGYTQADVTEVAKVFSGWTIDRPAEGGEYKFEPRRHQPGAKSVLGQGIPENGEAEGLRVLHMLAMSPATARFLSTEIAVRFVSDTPPPALIDRMSKSYLQSGGEIRVVLRTLFNSPEFWSPAVYRVKVKTPLEFVASALRATDADITNAVPVVQALDRLGMPLYGMQTPNGYSVMSEPWVSTGALVSRMNFALLLSSDHLPGTRTDLLRVAGSSGPGKPPSTISAGVKATSQPSASRAPAESPAIEELRLEQELLGAPASDRTRSAVLAETGGTDAAPKAAPPDLRKSMPAKPISAAAPTTPAQQTSTIAGLLLGSPEFQRR